MCPRHNPFLCAPPRTLTLYLVRPRTILFSVLHEHTLLPHSFASPFDPFAALSPAFTSFRTSFTSFSPAFVSLRLSCPSVTPWSLRAHPIAWGPIAYAPKSNLGLGLTFSLFYTSFSIPLLFKSLVYFISFLFPLLSKSLALLNSLFIPLLASRSILLYSISSPTPYQSLVQLLTIFNPTPCQSLVSTSHHLHSRSLSVARFSQSISIPTPFSRSFLHSPSQVPLLTSRSTTSLHLQSRSLSVARSFVRFFIPAPYQSLDYFILYLQSRSFPVARFYLTFFFTPAPSQSLAPLIHLHSRSLSVARFFTTYPGNNHPQSASLHASPTAPLHLPFHLLISCHLPFLLSSIFPRVLLFCALLVRVCSIDPVRYQCPTDIKETKFPDAKEVRYIYVPLALH